MHRPAALTIEGIIRERIPVHEKVTPIGGEINVSADCPFCHGRGTLDIMTDTQSWICWGCDAGGDVFSFLMQYHNIPFTTALRMLQDRLREEEGR